MPLIYAEDFFETADYTDDADLFLPLMPLIAAEVFLYRRLRGLRGLSINYRFYRLHR